MACGLIYREHLRTARGPLPRLQPRPAGGGEDGRADTARHGHSAPARHRPLRGSRCVGPALPAPGVGTCCWLRFRGE